jgi:hypothetical protein
MVLTRLHLLPLLFLLVAASPPFEHKTGFAGFKHTDIIERDVAIIGCGSSGTHASISLKDMGYTSIIVERTTRIGGHTETYFDPASGAPVDYGVVIFHDEDIIQNYFSRFNITLTKNISTLHSRTFDLRTGEAFTDDAFSPEQTATALRKYVEIISQWPDLDRGMFLPDPVPEDLTMSLGAFVKKHSIEAMVPLFSQLNPGLGDLLSVPMVENLRVAGLSLVRSLAAGFVTTEGHANQELYKRAQAELLEDSSLLLDSEVIFTKRSDAGVRLVVMTPQGKKMIIARRLLVTIPPRVSMIKNFDLSHNEMNVFSKFVNAGYFTSVVNNTGIPANLSVYNSDPLMPFRIPQLPSVYSIQETRVPGLHTAYYGTPRSLATSWSSDATVQAAIVRDIQRLQSSNPQLMGQTVPNFVASSFHTPFYLQVNGIDTQHGFYKSLYALQGARNTYWTGAAWRAQDSSSLWRFNEQIVVPRLVGGLQPCLELGGCS